MGEGKGAPEEGLLVAKGMRRGPGCRVEAEVRSDPGWPALARVLAGLAGVPVWLAPKLGVPFDWILGRGVVLAERVMAAAEDWGADEIVSMMLGVLGEMTEDAFDSLAHLGTSPRPRKAPNSSLSRERRFGKPRRRRRSSSPR